MNVTKPKLNRHDELKAKLIEQDKVAFASAAEAAKKRTIAARFRAMTQPWIRSWDERLNLVKSSRTMMSPIDGKRFDELLKAYKTAGDELVKFLKTVNQQ